MKSRCVFLILIWSLAGLAEAQDFPAERPSLSPGDLVQISVYQDPAMNTKHLVSKDGTVNLHYIGSVRVAGLTEQEAGVSIAQKLESGRFIKNPQVRVAVDQYAKRSITVQGEVVTPGACILPLQGVVYLMQAISYAGGPTRRANLTKVTIQREEDGRSVIHRINLKENTRQAQPFRVLPGDVITVFERAF